MRERASAKELRPPRLPWGCSNIVGLDPTVGMGAGLKGEEESRGWGSIWHGLWELKHWIQLFVLRDPTTHSSCFNYTYGKVIISYKSASLHTDIIRKEEIFFRYKFLSEYYQGSSTQRNLPAYLRVSISPTKTTLSSTNSRLLPYLCNLQVRSQRS